MKTIIMVSILLLSIQFSHAEVIECGNEKGLSIADYPNLNCTFEPSEPIKPKDNVRSCRLSSISENGITLTVVIEKQEGTVNLKDYKRRYK